MIIVVAMVVAAIWAAIVAVLKVTRGVSEVISFDHAELHRPRRWRPTCSPARSGEAPPGASIVATAPIPQSGWLPGLNSIFDALGLANRRASCTAS